MTPALKSRLSAERLFTVEDMALAVESAVVSALDHYSTAKGKDIPRVAGSYADFARSAALARVQAHLSSDTTTIRPLKA